MSNEVSEVSTVASQPAITPMANEVGAAATAHATLDVLSVNMVNSVQFIRLYGKYGFNTLVNTITCKSIVRFR
jgi:hypothetical protein